MTHDPTSSDHQDVIRHLARLADLVHAEQTVTAVSQRLVDIAPQVVPGCDHASVMSRQGARYRTLASSDEVAETVDRLERMLGEGPCVDAITSDAYQLDADIARSCQWPALAEQVLTQTPVRGMAGYRLVVDGEKLGALNLFSDEADALTGEAADIGALLAAFASVALAGVEHREQAQTLQHGLQSNREIGTAIGLLMAAHDLSQDAAFDLLRRASSELNRKLADVAQDVVANRGAPRAG